MRTSRKTDFCSRDMTTKGLTSRTMALHVYYKTLYISELSLQNNVKSLHFVYLRQLESRQQMFHVSIGK